MEWKKIGSAALSNNLVLLAAIGLVVFAYLKYAPDSLKPWTNKPTAPAVVADAPKPVEKIKRVLVPGPTKVEVIEKTVYIEKMPDVLQPATVADDNAHVIASAEIPPYNGKTIATAILETRDGIGRGRIETKQEPIPFFAVKKEFSVSARYMFSGINQVEADLTAKPFRTGPIEWSGGVGAEVRREDSDLGARLWLGAEYKF
jgi:hypothetical protein